MRLAGRLFLTLGSTVAVAVVGVTLLLSAVFESIGRRNTEQVSEHALRVFSAFAADRERHFLDRLHAVLGDIRTHARVEAALEGDDVSLLELLEDWAAPESRSDYDLVALYDRGRVLRAVVASPAYAELETGALQVFDHFGWRIALFAQPPADEGPLRHALSHLVEPLYKGEKEVSRFILEGAIPCLTLGTRFGGWKTTLGALVFARAGRLDEMREIQSAALVDIAIASQRGLLLSTLPPDRHEELRRALPSPVGTERRSLMVALGGDPYELFLMPALTDPDGNTPVRLVVVSLAEQHRLLATARYGSAAVGLCALALLLAATRGLARSLSRPVLEMLSGTRLVSSGDYGVRLEERGPDEIKELSRSFNEMTRGLAEKERVRSILDKVVSREIAAELLAHGVALGGELRSVTVLFSDIRGFTSATENMPPEEVVALLNEAHSRATEAIEERKGVIDKYLGDGIMALFGAPIDLKNHALIAAQAGLAIQERLEALNAERARTGKPPIRVGVGIHTGTVVCGNIGSRDRLSYTAIGAVVNLASRICGVADPGTVLVSKTTREALPAGARAIELASLILRGISSPVTLYRIEALPV